MNRHLRNVSEDVQLIYSRIGDDVSRRVFENRLLMTLMQKKEKNGVISELRKKRDKDERLMKFMDGLKTLDGDIFIYGAGECGRYLCGSKYMEGIPLKGFIDNREWQKGTVQNMPVFQFEDVTSKGRVNVILSMESYVSRQQIKKQISEKRSSWKIMGCG